MRRQSEYGLVAVWAALLAGTGIHLGWVALMLAALFAVIWFCVVLVLLHRPPGVPQFDFSKAHTTDSFYSRRNIESPVAAEDRLQLALGVACGVCVLIWCCLANFSGITDASQPISSPVVLDSPGEGLPAGPTTAPPGETTPK